MRGEIDRPVIEIQSRATLDAVVWADGEISERKLRRGIPLGKPFVYGKARLVQVVCCSSVDPLWMDVESFLGCGKAQGEAPGNTGGNTGHPRSSSPTFRHIAAVTDFFLQSECKPTLATARTCVNELLGARSSFHLGLVPGNHFEGFGERL